MAPIFAKLTWGDLNICLYIKQKGQKGLMFWVLFLDDIFLICRGDKDSLINFKDWLNNVVPSIKLNKFLDTTVLKDVQGNINQH